MRGTPQAWPRQRWGGQGNVRKGAGPDLRHRESARRCCTMDTSSRTPSWADPRMPDGRHAERHVGPCVRRGPLDSTRRHGAPGSTASSPRSTWSYDQMSSWSAAASASPLTFRTGSNACGCARRSFRAALRNDAGIVGAAMAAYAVKGGPLTAMPSRSSDSAQRVRCRVDVPVPHRAAQQEGHVAGHRPRPQATPPQRGMDEVGTHGTSCVLGVPV